MRKTFVAILMACLLIPFFANGLSVYTFSQGGTNNSGPYASGTVIMSNGNKFLGLSSTSLPYVLFSAFSDLFYQYFHGTTTDALPQGSTNKYDQIVTLTGVGSTTVTGTYPNFVISSTGATTASTTWGTITGTLSNQLDLASALLGKLSLTDWYATTTDGLAEGSTNLYEDGIHFSTTSADHWLGLKDKGYFFSTTSADYWVSLKGFLTSFTETDPIYSVSSTTILRTGTTSDALTEGTVNLFWTPARLIAGLLNGYNAIFGTATTTNLVATNATTTNTHRIGTMWSDVASSTNAIFGNATITNLNVTGNATATDIFITNNNDTITGGQRVTREHSGFGDFTQSTITFSTSTRTFTIAPLPGSSYDYYLSGIKFTTTTPASVVIPNVAGQLNYVYFNNNLTGQITQSTAPWNFYDAQIATVYWNGSDALIGFDRHGVTMDWATHKYLHNTIGMRYQSGLTGSYTDTAFSMTAGIVNDEDNIDNIGATTSTRLLYRTPSYMTFTSATTSWYYKLGANIAYDNGGTLTALGANQYSCSYVYATNERTNPLYTFVGQATYTTLAQARTGCVPGNLALGNLVVPEMKLLYIVILRNDATPYEETIDYRAVSSGPAGTFTPTDHGTLTGLADDDHTQYAILSAVRGVQTFLGDLIFGGFTATNSTTTNATTTNFYLSGLFKDTSNSIGTNGQVLSSTGTSTQWRTLNIPASFSTTSANYWATSTQVAHLNGNEDFTGLKNFTNPTTTIGANGYPVFFESLSLLGGALQGTEMYGANSLGIPTLPIRDSILIRGANGNPGILFISADAATSTTFGFNILNDTLDSGSEITVPSGNSLDWSQAFGWGNWKTGLSALGPATYNNSTGVIGWSNPGYITATSSETLSNKSGLISQWTNDAGYLDVYNGEPLWNSASTSVAYLANTQSFTGTNNFHDINITDGYYLRYNSIPFLSASTTLDNYFLGQSGNLTATGNSNYCWGTSACSSLTSGFVNIGIGNLTLNQTTSGTWNLAIGNASLQNNTTGKGNMALGTGVLQNNITGDSNVGIGQGALNKNTIAGLNTAIGLNALYNSIWAGPGIPAGGNTAIGYQAGYNNTGQYNTFIGKEADTLSTATTSSFGIAIGNGIKIGADYATAIGGLRNVVIGMYSGLFGGADNTNAGTRSNIFGGDHLYINGLADLSTLIGGAYNNLFGARATIAGGTGNVITANGADSFIGGGAGNVADGQYTGIINSISSYTSGMGSSAFGTLQSTTTGMGALALSGQYNQALAQGAIVIAGQFSIADALGTTVVNSQFSNNHATGSNMIGGFLSNIGTGADGSLLISASSSDINAPIGTIIGGEDNTINNVGGFILGGVSNVLNGMFDYAIGPLNIINGNNSIGINLNYVPSTINQSNTLAIMNGFTGIGTTTPDTILGIDGGTVLDPVDENYYMGYTKFNYKNYLALLDTTFYITDYSIASSTKASTTNIFPNIAKAGEGVSSTDFGIGGFNFHGGAGGIFINYSDGNPALQIINADNTGPGLQVSQGYAEFDGMVMIIGGGSFVNYGVCYADANGTLGHCTSALNSSGVCTCSPNEGS